MQILEEFSWYDDLAAILEGNPAVSLKTISSVPGMDHASKYFSLLQAGTTGSAQSFSSTQYGGYVPSAQPPPPSAQPPPLTAMPITLALVPSLIMHLAPTLQRPPPIHLSPTLILAKASTISPLITRMGGWTTTTTIPQQPPQAPIHPQMPTPIHSVASITSPPHTEFKLPKKPQTMQHNSHAAFGTPDPTRRISEGLLKPLSGLRSSHLWSTPTSTSSVTMLTTLTSQSASSEKNMGRPSKKARSDILNQVGAITNKIGSIHSKKLSKVSHEELKNNCYMAKLNLTRQENEHWFLQAERQDECMDAATVHQCSQEAKDTEIRLCIAEARMHESLAKVHAEEAALLHLKIQYHQLTGGS
ncbi:uncharacterized protein EDB93DRAFT_1250111 [Suillus bovinus]|uniref:uncharacterized protein n=1 Tax=Suillus bovinus TaxID=48563 RepID=UPI001B8719E9|nr:uncharacterized protein EDB93DRAFT_1250111 [Suillus bovinus]KAG2148676.1 hypothetical protein EDB93DRAFT_1250111 [Suillus bovinus]